ncbi:MAG TPA: 4Fe-4S cluster-binding domain-containing protein, partial [Tepiditoga sp.]|nr:4Fe-4S cluster-binding domain-containing protein [Tepiditoga sp.]
KKISTVVFTSGCNFNCLYCHNQLLKNKTSAEITEKMIYDFFIKRRNTVDALTITGGEPSLYGEELLDFIHRFRNMFPDKQVKVDTNGSDTDFLKNLKETADFIAMDFKSTNYGLFSEISDEIIKKSLSILSDFKNHEVRITVYPYYIPENDFEKISEIISMSGIKNVSVQQYRPVDNIKPYSINILNNFKNILENKNLSVIIK